MNVGLLWFDNDLKADLPTKITRAAACYQHKYGQAPDLCYVHPSIFKEGQTTGKIEIRPNRSILPNHFWIGLEEKEAK